MTPTGFKPGRASALQHELLDALGIDTVAWSADGRTFGFIARLGAAMPLGGYVRITTADGRVLLGQVHDCHAVQTDLGRVEGVTAGVSLKLPIRHLEGSGRLQGVLRGRRLEPFVQPAGFGDASMAPAGAREVATLRRAELDGAAAMELGVLTSVPEVVANIRAKGFNRHTLLCGQSGSGKTFSTGVLLEQLLLATTLQFVVIDPNSDHVHLARLRTFADYNRTRTHPISQPAYDRLAKRYRRAADDVQVTSTRKGDVPLKVRFSHLTITEQALCLRLDALRDLEEYNLLVRIADGLGTERYTVDDVHAVALGEAEHDDTARRLAQRIENLGVARWGLWAANDADAIGDGPFIGRALVVDTGSLPDPSERAVAALVVFGRLERRPTRSPILLVVDEAHNVCPPTSENPLVEAATEHAIWAAGEGRKYGIFLLLATQRPQKLHPNVVSQCENLVLMRVNSHADREYISTLFSQVPPALVEESAVFDLGDALVAGPVSPTPARVSIGGRLSVEGGADLPTDWAR